MRLPKALTRHLLLAILLLCSGATTARAARFTTDTCEFSVDFPGAFEVRDVYLDGQSAKLAMSKTYPWGQLSAECWPIRTPQSLATYARGVEDSLREQGWTPTSSSSKQGRLGPVVLVMASRLTNGRRFNLSIETYFGQRSRLETKLVQLDLAGVEPYDKFRGSIRIR